jgi:hypothetical protein
MHQAEDDEKKQADDEEERGEITPRSVFKTVAVAAVAVFQQSFILGQSCSWRLRS